MSKEKQCECCHEWWYDSDVKENLCPNCYDYFKQLKRQLEEKDKESERLKNLFELNNEVVINQGKEIFDLRVQILQQKQNQTQLAIQELEKVKNYCDKQFNLWENNNFNETYDNTDVSHAYFVIFFIIKEKIKELKGE